MKISKTSLLELQFEQILKQNKIKYQREYKFSPTRRWRFDFLIDKNIAVEIEGGVFIGGRHTRGVGFVKDMEKYNNAVILGYKILRYYSKTLHNFLNDYREIRKKAKKD